MLSPTNAELTFFFFVVVHIRVRGFISPMLQQRLKVYRADKYKNVENTGGFYEDSKPIEHYKQAGMRFGCAAGDPPYTMQSGNHNASNCSLRRSEGSIKKNDQYGVSYAYTRDNIMHLIIEFLDDMKTLLVPYGICLLKVMDSEKAGPVAHDSISLALERGFSYLGVYYYTGAKSGSILHPSDYSTMIVFQLKSCTRALSTTAIVNKSVVDYQTHAHKSDEKEKEAIQSLHNFVAMLSTQFSSLQSFEEVICPMYLNNQARLTRFRKKYNLLGKDKNVAFKRLQENGRIVQKRMKAARQSEQIVNENTYQVKRSSSQTGSMEKFVSKKSARK